MEEDVVWSDVPYHVVYHDCDTFDGLPYEKIRQHYGVCFVGEKIVICWDERRKAWSLPGGTVESGELINDALVREVREESNMTIVMRVPIGYQEIFSEDGSSIIQLRSCCIVEPLGDFVSDPAGSITKITLIDLEEWDEYIHWGIIGKHIRQRAIEIKKV